MVTSSLAPPSSPPTSPGVKKKRSVLASHSCSRMASPLLLPMESQLAGPRAMACSASVPALASSTVTLMAPSESRHSERSSARAPGTRRRAFAFWIGV